jgi:hypothetical protein
MSDQKTKKIDRVDLPESAFAYVGDPEDTSTWKLPIHFPGDPAKTINHLKNGLARFPDTKGISDADRSAVWLLVVGAALAHGIKVERPHFAAKREESTQPPAQREAVHVQPELKTTKDQSVEAAVAMADRFADAMLRSLGLE